MIRFKQFIIEGGNLKVNVNGTTVQSDPIKVSASNRQKHVDDIKGALNHIHDSFHSATGQHLFGNNKQALKNDQIYAGSTRSFMNTKNISHEEFAKHKPSVGDIDVQVPKEHKDALHNHMQPGMKFGKYTVVGSKKHGTEFSAVMKHDNGNKHQFDFEAVNYHKDRPDAGEQFTRSSHWDDIKKGIKGAHHSILLNAAGIDKHKFSLAYGLRSRSNESDKGIKDPHEVSKRLFGNDADHSKIHSFGGTAELIAKHKTPKEQGQIFSKFHDSLSKIKNMDHEKALHHLGKTLGISY